MASLAEMLEEAQQRLAGAVERLRAPHAVGREYWAEIQRLKPEADRRHGINPDDPLYCATRASAEAVAAVASLVAQAEALQETWGKRGSDPTAQLETLHALESAISMQQEAAERMIYAAYGALRAAQSIARADGLIPE